MHNLNYDDRIRSALKRKRISIVKRGLHEGRKNAHAIGSDFIKKFEEGLRILDRAKINLVDEVAQEFILAKLENDPLIIVAMIKNVLKQVADFTDVEIALHPLDAAQLKLFLGQNQSLGETARKLNVVDDKALMRGSIIVKANKSIVDAHLTTQIERAKELIAFEINHGRTD